jgi:hypothetical protein
MSKDASEFSLEKVWSAIKPHVEDLPFRRLGDYIQHVSPGRSKQIGCIVYYFDLWLRHSSIPGDADINTKAYSFTLGSEIMYHPSDTKHLKHPLSVRFKDLVLVCSTNESCHWLFQTSDFSPNHMSKPSGFFYKGRSKLIWVEDENFTKLTAPYNGFSADFWMQLANWAQGSIDDRNAINKKLHELKEISTDEILKLARTSAS